MSRSRGIQAGVVALSAVLAASCGSTTSKSSANPGDTSGTTTATTAAAAAVSGHNYKIVYIGGVSGNPFYTSVGCGGAAQAKTMGVSFSEQEPNTYDPTVQIPIVNAVIAQHPDAIMIAVDSPTALIAPLSRAKAAGIKVLTVDGTLNQAGVAITNVQSDDLKGGELAGDALAKLIGGTGSVVAIYNKPGSNVSDARVKGFEQAISKYPNIHYLGVQSSNNETSLAASTIQDEILAHPDLKGVFSVTTNNTEGVATGVSGAGKTGKVKIVGYDTSAPIVKDIQDGTVSADVVQAPYQTGQEEVKLAVDALEGKAVPSQVTEPFVVATPQNINTPQVQSYVYKTHC